jgi:hypothetical protein
MEIQPDRLHVIKYVFMYVCMYACKESVANL